MFIHSKIDNLINKLQLSRKGITIQDMANEMQISISTLNKIKSGLNSPSVDTVEIIANYFGVDMNYFFETTDSVVNANMKLNSPPPEYGQKNPWQLLYEKQEEITELKCELERLKNVCAHGNGAKAG